MKQQVEKNSARFKEKTLDSELIYDGKIIKLFRDGVMLENGKKAVREVVKHPGGVCILAIDENPSDKNNPFVVFVSQYRYPQGKTLIELPAGKLEYGEEPLECAIRELAEETGYIAGKFTDFGLIIPTPAYDTEKIYCFIAEELKVSEQKLDEDEFLDVIRLPLSEAVKTVLSGEAEDSKTVAFLMKYCVKLQNESG